MQIKGTAQLLTGDERHPLSASACQELCLRRKDYESMQHRYCVAWMQCSKVACIKCLSRGSQEVLQVEELTNSQENSRTRTQPVACATQKVKHLCAACYSSCCFYFAGLLTCFIEQQSVTRRFARAAKTRRSSWRLRTKRACATDGMSSLEGWHAALGHLLPVWRGADKVFRGTFACGTVSYCGGDETQLSRYAHCGS